MAAQRERGNVCLFCFKAVEGFKAAEIFLWTQYFDDFSLNWLMKTHLEVKSSKIGQIEALDSKKGFHNTNYH